MKKVKPLFYKWWKFLFFWFITYSVNLWLTYYFIEKLWFDLYISYSISLLIVTILNFFLSLKIIFISDYSNKIFTKYLSFLIWFSFLNYFLVNLLSYNFWEKDKYYFIFLVTTIFFFLKFFVYDKFVFISK